MPAVSRAFTCSIIALAAGAMAAVAPAWAQVEPSAPAVWPKILTRGLFSANGEFVKSDTPNRPADALVHVALDVLDLGAVRIPFDFTFAAAFNNRRYPVFVDYSYLIGPAVRLGGIDVTAFLHHTSRHVHDVVRPEPVSWNQVGLSASGTVVSGRLGLRWAASTTWYPPYARRYVDYSWDVAGAVRAIYTISPRSAYYAGGVVRVLRCMPEIAGRDGALGTRIETGMNLAFGFGRVDVFAGFDRRIDPATFSRTVQNYYVAGVRFMIARGGGAWSFIVPLREGRPLQ